MYNVLDAQGPGVEIMAGSRDFDHSTNQVRLAIIICVAAFIQRWGGDRAGACICSKYPLRRQDTGFARPESCLEIKDGEPVELLLTPQATSPEHEVVQKVKGGLQLVQGKRKEWPVGWALTVTYINFTKEIKKEVSEMTNENSH